MTPPLPANLRAVASCVLAVAALAGAPARAEVYSYVDAEGVVHFTNTPRPGARLFSPGHDDAGFGGAAVTAEGRYANTPRMWRAAALRRDKGLAYTAIIHAAARRYRLPPALVKAVMAAESGFNPAARSHAGACGLMQLMPVTAREMGVEDIFDPEQNIHGGARYLRYLINHFSGDVKLAVAAYNAGPNLVARLGRVPNIPETRTYVRRVLGLYRTYRGDMPALPAGELHATRDPLER